MINAAHFLSYEKLRQQQEICTSTQQDSTVGKISSPQVDRWKLLRSLTEAREAYEISHRTITVLEALMSFHSDKNFSADNSLIVFPSNKELSMRLRGMSAPTIRRHIASLISMGFILRRDSPNGKRFVRRDRDGEIAMAFGFDLTPLLYKASEIEIYAEKAREESRKRQQLRYTITIHLRDISKTIQAAINEQILGDWTSLLLRLQQLSGRVERNGTLISLTEREHALEQLRIDVESLYISSISEPKISGNELENEHHIQNTELEYIDKKDANETEKYVHTIADKNLEKKQSMLNNTPSLKTILQACPQIETYANYGIRNWTDLVITAAHIRSMLGISRSAWQSACASMGDINAAITIATMLERSDAIRSAGGYLRKLTEKAQIGKYSITPVLRALENTHH